MSCRGVWRRLLPGLLLLVCAGVRAETTVAAGVLSSSTRWTLAGSPYRVLGGVAVYGPTGPRLTIDAGVEVRFAPGAWLQFGQTSYPFAGGQLRAVGTADQPIHFTAESGQPGGWQGLCFPGGSPVPGLDSRLEFCEVEFATVGLLIENTASPDSLVDCVFRHSAGRALELTGAAPVLARCRFEYNPTAVRITNAQSTVLGGSPEQACSFLGSDPWFVDNRGSGLVDARYNHWCVPDEGPLDGLIRDAADDPALGVVETWPMAAGPEVRLGLNYLRAEGLLVLEWECEAPAPSYTVYASPSVRPGATYLPLATTTEPRLVMQAPTIPTRQFFRVVADLPPCDAAPAE